MAWIALGASAYFAFRSEHQLAGRQTMLRAFDAHAREASSALADLHAAQEAYVAAGQGVAFWTQKVSGLMDTATAAVDGLRGSTVDSGALGSLADASSTIGEFGNADKRAREYLKSNDELMAADVVFTEGGQAAATAGRQIEAAVNAEHESFDAFEGGQRKLEAYAVAGAGGFGALMMLLLAFAPGKELTPADAQGGLSLHEAPAAVTSDLPRASAPALKAAAELCTEFGRVNDPSDLTKLLARSADLMEASGLVVWLGNSSGADLRPVLAYGYPPNALARMPVVPRSADNAAAAAYRTGALQIVLAGPGGERGALVAPLLSPDGCVGAFSAEIKGGAETADSVQSLAAIFAAQITGVLSASTAMTADAEPRAANS